MKFKNYLTKDVKLISSILKDHTVILVIIILSYIATYVLNLYLANILKPRLYGDIAIVFQLLLFSMPFALLGTEMSMMHYLPKYFEEKAYPLASGFLRWNLRLFIWTTIAVLGLGFVGAIIATIFDALGHHSFDEYHIVIFSFWLVPLYALIVLLATVLQSLHKTYLSAIFRGFAVTFLILLNIALFLRIFESTWIGDYRRPESIVLCMAIAYVLIIIAQIFIVYRKLPKEVFTAKPHYQNKRWTLHSVEMLGSAIGYTALGAIQIMMLEFFHVSEDAVGYFAAILVIASSLMVFGLAVDTLVNPLISAIIHKNKTHLQSIIDIVNIFKLAPAILLFIVIIIFGHSLLRHFGKSFVEVYPDLLVLTLGYFAGVCFNSAMPLLLYSDHHMINFKISLAQLAFILIVGSILIPLMGISGAAWSLSLTIILAGCIRTYYVHKFLDIKVLFVV